MTNYKDNNNTDFDDDLSISIDDGEDDSTEDDAPANINTILGALRALYYPAAFYYHPENNCWMMQVTESDGVIYNLKQRIKNDGLIKVTFSLDTDTKNFTNTLIAYSFTTIDTSRLIGKLIDKLAICRALLSPQTEMLRLHHSGNGIFPYPHLRMKCASKEDFLVDCNIYYKLRECKFVPTTSLIPREKSFILPCIDWYGVIKTTQLNNAPENKRVMLEELKLLAEHIAKYGAKNASDPILQHLVALSSELKTQIDAYENSTVYNVLAFKQELVAAVENSAFMQALQKSAAPKGEESYNVLQNVLRLLTFWGTSLFRKIKKNLPPSFLDSSQEKGEKMEKKIQKNIGKILDPNSGFFSAGNSISVPKPTMKCRY